MHRRNVVVLGAGVVGLTTALHLAQSKAYNVTIVAREYTPNTKASDLSGGMIAYMDIEGPLARISKAKFKDIAKFDGVRAGVKMTPCHVLYRSKDALEERDSILKQHPSCRKATKQECRGAKCGFVCNMPVVTMPIYLRYLMDRLKEHGVEMKRMTVSRLSDVFELFPNTQIVINCTGTGSKELADDKDVQPVAGHMILIEHNAITLKDYTLYFDEENPGGYTYFMPRADGCIMGGSKQVGVSSQVVNREIIDGILDRIDKLVPHLKVKKAKILKTWVGLRPSRKSGMRIELEQTKRGVVIHNYGHAGVGVSYSWGSAFKVEELIASLSSKL